VRISGFSAPELAHTLRALSPPSVAVADAGSGPAARSAHTVHATYPRAVRDVDAQPGSQATTDDEEPILLLVAAAGVSSLAPLRMRLARVVAEPEAAGPQLRIVDTESATRDAARTRPDVILTRIERHDPSAIEAIAALRDTWRVPIAATITPSIAIADIDALVTVLDDYRVEPVRADELLIRIRCLVSRHRRAVHARDDAAPADALLQIDDGAKLVTLQGRTLHLTPKEFELLRLLASQSGRVFSDAEIIQHLWPGSPHAAPVDVAQYVHRLRKKLNDNPCAPQWIFNIKRFGYMLRRLSPQFTPAAASVPSTPKAPPLRAPSHFDSL